MDSCNSGSLQSSSGGDEEYDSRATFMIGGIGQINPNPPPPTPFFDPFITNYTQQQHIISYSKTTPSITDNNNISPNNYTFTHPLHPQPSTAPPPPPNTTACNPKKRSRASRRAPTTVLTTDTTNFRAMVQEFTGIPAPPFNNMVTSSFARNRFDLFASSIDMPSYLRSSFAQRVQSAPVLPFHAGAGNINKDNIIGSNAVASSSSTQSLNNLSNIVEEQNPFLGSINLPPDHLKIDSFGLGSKDGNQIHGSVGFFSTSASTDHGQIGSSNLNNSNISATFDGGLQNLIIPSSSSTNNNVSHLLTRIQEDVDDYDQFTGKNMVTNNYPGLSGSKLNVVEKVPENGSERQGMVETWICSSSE